MAKARKQSLAERVRQRRLAAASQEPQEISQAPETLRDEEALQAAGDVDPHPPGSLPDPQAAGPLPEPPIAEPAAPSIAVHAPDLQTAGLADPVDGPLPEPPIAEPAAPPIAVHAPDLQTAGLADPVDAPLPEPPIAEPEEPVAVQPPVEDDPLPEPQASAKLELVFEEAAVSGEDPEPDEMEPPPESGGVQQSIAPISGLSDTPARLKRGIALLAVVAAVAGVAIGVKIMRSAPAGEVLNAQTAAPREQAPVALPPSAALPSPPEASSPPPAASEPTTVPVVSERTASAAALRDQALDLLKKYKNPEAMEKASAALEADPSDAMPYLVLGSALQDAGHWKEAHHAYELCAKNATKGMVDECRAMLRSR